MNLSFFSHCHNPRYQQTWSGPPYQELPLLGTSSICTQQPPWPWERDKSDTTTLLPKNWMDSFEIQDEEKACSHPRRMSMRRDRAQSGWSYLPSTLLAALLFLPVPGTLLFPVPPVLHFLLHAVFSPLSAYLATWQTLSVVCCSEKPSLTSHYTPLGTMHRPLPTIRHSWVMHLVTPCAWQTPTSLTRLQGACPNCPVCCSSAPGMSVRTHQMTLFLVKLKNTSAYPSRQLKHHLLTSLRIPYLTQTTGACSSSSITLFHKCTTALMALQGHRLFICLVPSPGSCFLCFICAVLQQLANLAIV